MRGPEAGFKAMACLLGSQGSAGVGGAHACLFYFLCAL